jgi:hypothetical protein
LASPAFALTPDGQSGKRGRLPRLTPLATTERRRVSAAYHHAATRTTLAMATSGHGSKTADPGGTELGCRAGQWRQHMGTETARLSRYPQYTFEVPVMPAKRRPRATFEAGATESAASNATVTLGNFGLPATNTVRCCRAVGNGRQLQDGRSTRPLRDSSLHSQAGEEEGGPLLCSDIGAGRTSAGCNHRPLSCCIATVALVNRGCRLGPACGSSLVVMPSSAIEQRRLSPLGWEGCKLRPNIRPFERSTPPVRLALPGQQPAPAASPFIAHE